MAGAVGAGRAVVGEDPHGDGASVPVTQAHGAGAAEGTVRGEDEAGRVGQEAGGGAAHDLVGRVTQQPSRALVPLPQHAAVVDDRPRRGGIVVRVLRAHPRHFLAPTPGEQGLHTSYPG